MRNRKILMFVPYSINRMDNAPKIRAYNMYHALKSVVPTELISGYPIQKPLNPKIQSQKNHFPLTFGRILPELMQIFKKNKIDYIYIETGSSLYHFDYIFLNMLKKRGISIFPFIRDLYWRYPGTLKQDKQTDKWFRYCQREYDWYLKNAAALLFPAKSMADAVDFPEKYLLPPAGDSYRCMNPELPQTKNVVFVGGLYPKAGVDILLNAMEYVINEHPDAYCTIIGHGDLDILNKWKHKKWLHFTTGSYWDMPDIMSSAYIATIPWSTVLPHNNITMPYKLFDYMSFGRPIVATNCKETAKFIRENEVGIVIDSTPEDFAAGIIKLLDDRELAKRLGQNALSLIEKKHSWKHRAKELVEIMERYES